MKNDLLEEAKRLEEFIGSNVLAVRGKEDEHGWRHVPGEGCRHCQALDDLRVLVERLEQQRELVEAATALADYWPSQNVEKHYSERMQLLRLAVCALAAQQREDEEPFEYKIGDKICSWGVIRDGERIRFPWLT